MINWKIGVPVSLIITATFVSAAPLLELDTAPPPEIGHLHRCYEATNWQIHRAPICLRIFGQGGCKGEFKQSLEIEQCFRIRQGNEVLVLGAVIPAESARLLRIPVLVVKRESDNSIVELMSDWPGVKGAIPSWMLRLSRLTEGKDVRLHSNAP